MLKGTRCVFACRTTTSGQPCQLPFFYNGALNYNCISSQPGQAGACLNPLGRFEPCRSPARLTVSGSPCVFPSVMGNRWVAYAC